MNRRTLVLFALAAAMPLAYLAFASDAPTSDIADGTSSRPAARPASPATRTATAAKPTHGSPASLPAEFQVLLKRNIFLGGSTSSRSSGSPGAPPTPEDLFVLRGIMHQSGQHTALIEDLSTRHVRRVVAGDSIARGVLRSVSFDGLEYEGQESPVRVAIGQKLSGVFMNDPVIVARPSKSSSSERASAERSSGERSSGERAAIEKSSGERSISDKSSADKSSGDRSPGEKPQAEHAWRLMGSERERGREQEGDRRDDRDRRDATTRVETGG